jgi:hypothetical protein
MSDSGVATAVYLRQTSRNILYLARSMNDTPNWEAPIALNGVIDVSQSTLDLAVDAATGMNYAVLWGNNISGANQMRVRRLNSLTNLEASGLAGVPREATLAMNAKGQAIAIWSRVNDSNSTSQVYTATLP